MCHFFSRPTDQFLPKTPETGDAGNRVGHNLLQSFGISAQPLAPPCQAPKKPHLRAIWDLRDYHRPTPGLYDALKKDKTMGIALFCTYPLCSSAIKPLQLPQSLSSRQDRRGLVPSPRSFPAVPGQAASPSRHRNEFPTRRLGFPPKELHVIAHSTISKSSFGNFKAATIEQVAKTKSFS